MAIKALNLVKGNEFMRKLLLYLNILVGFGFINHAVFAGDYGGYAGAFLRMGLGARPHALGGAYTAVAEGSYAGYYNPGGLPRSADREFNFSYRSLSLDRTFNYLGCVIPIQPKVKSGEKTFNAGIHLGWIHAGVDNIDGRDGDGRHYETFSNSENAFAFGFAIQPQSWLSVGFTTKILYNRFPKMTKDNETLTSKGLGFDLGLLVTPISHLSVGVLVKDLRSKYTWNTEKVWERGTTTYNPFPVILKFGLAYRLLNDRLLVAADIEDNKKQPEKYHFGAEFVPYPRVALRAGFDTDAPTFGLGYGFKFWKIYSVLDYAFLTNDIAPSDEHVFSWSFHF